jgi:hypothetical protein
VISISLGLVLAALPLAALVGPLVWMASHDVTSDGGYPSPPMSAASLADQPALG